MRVIQSARASSEYWEIFSYLFQESDSSAEKFINSYERVCANLSEQEWMGYRPEASPSEMIRCVGLTGFKHLRITYEIDGDTVVIQRVADTRRKPETLWS